MSRYTGPRVRVLRALGSELPGLSRKKHDRRPYPPGQHGQRRRKLSEFALRLLEKQKLRMNYGITERQLRSVMKQAHGGRGNTGERLVQLLERRLDNVVFRAGFAPTIAAARQLVTHGHVTVNGRRVDVASYRVRPEEVVSLRESSKNLAPIVASLTSPPPFQTQWLDVSAERREARVTMLPDGSSIPSLSIQRVVEFYSQRT